MVRSLCLALCCAMVAVLMVPSEAYPSPGYYYHDEGQYEPEEIADMITRLHNLIQMERKMESIKDDITSSKRGLDLGLDRGHSGVLQAKHLMAMAAAADAGGPGRKRSNAY